MAKVTYVLAQGENSAGESQVNFRVYVSRELRVRVPSGIWVDRKRWGKKNDINIPNIPGEAPCSILLFVNKSCISLHQRNKSWIDSISHPFSPALLF